MKPTPVLPALSAPLLLRGATAAGLLLLTLTVTLFVTGPAAPPAAASPATSTAVVDRAGYARGWSFVVDRQDDTEVTDAAVLRACAVWAAAADPATAGAITAGCWDAADRTLLGGDRAP